MPIDSMLVSAAVILMFLMFAGVLMWGEVHGRPERRKPVPPPENAAKKYRRTTLRFVPEDPAGNTGMSRDLSDAAMERSLESQDAQKWSVYKKYLAANRRRERKPS